MSIQNVNNNAPLQLNEQAPVSETTKTSSLMSTSSDVSGVPGKMVLQDHTLPPIASNRSDLEAALNTLLGKSTQLYEALSMLVPMFSSAGASSETMTLKANDLLNKFFSGASSVSGLSSFLGGIEEMIAQARASANGNVHILNVCNTAKSLIDLLSDPEKFKENQHQVRTLLNDLKSQGANIPQDNPLSQLGAALATVFSIVLEGANLSYQLEELLKNMPNLFLFLQNRAPDAFIFSNMVTTSALMGLVMLLSTQLLEEVAGRMSQAEDADKAREEQKELLKKLDAKKEFERKTETATNVANSSSAFNAALTTTFAQGLVGGMADAFGLLQNKLIESKQLAKPIEA